ncbi:MAG: hypothetical protein IKU57_05135 [Oscillospiraceae bacterium]|nr:hypothetical protein [Oscillospiraceae bacterium]
MKKLICLILSLLLLVSLAACGGAETPEGPQNFGNDTPAPTGDTAADQQEEAEEGFYFLYEDVKLIPGTTFDETLLPEYNDKYEVESCANQGTDILYNYNTFELTAYNGKEIYSIYLIDPNTPTTEGLYVGDTRVDVEKLYGTDYVEEDGEVIFTKGATQLRLIMEDDVVSSIEYRMVTE